MRPPIRWPFAVLAYLCIGLALIGLFLPGIPTVPFLLLAAWAAERGSQHLHDWLHRHKRFGPPLRLWREQGAVSTRAKVVAVLLLLVSWLLMAWRAEPLWVPVATGILFIAVGGYLLSRPVPLPSATARE